MNLERSWKMKRVGLGDEERRTAYCGLHCGDCIPSRDGLYSALIEARKQLADVDFHAYCRIRSRRDPRLEKYQDFEDTLDAIMATRCPLPCREGGERPIAACVIVRGKGGLRVTGSVLLLRYVRSWSRSGSTIRSTRTCASSANWG